MILDEASRHQLIDKSKSADIVKSYGTTRYDRRIKQHQSRSLQSFNLIDMNALFRANLLSFKIPVQGETNNYEVEILFEGICDDINREIKANHDVFEYKCVYRALVAAINKQDILVACTCPDQKYRMAYAATKGNYNGGQPEVRPAKITNPNDTKGAGCKHILNVLASLDWALKLASTIFNYVNYMEDKYNDKYVRIIYPAIYKTPYKEQEDAELADTMDREEDKDILKQANKAGDQHLRRDQIKDINKKAAYEEPEDDTE